MRLAHVLYLDAGFRRQRRSGLSDEFAQRLGELWAIEDTDSAAVEMPRHPVGVAYRRQRSGDHQSVVPAIRSA
jgi:hypothetical protein